MAKLRTARFVTRCRIFGFFAGLAGASGGFRAGLAADDGVALLDGRGPAAAR